MYQALYRKWRPKTFDDVIGQPHVTETLTRQIESGRISHAYLFIGTRGTGKTSCAKILAKAVNCETPRGGNPCNICNACVGIDDGSILDVEELDAASNNGVDHVRALRDEAVFTPAVVRRRVYIIDEVHGLSTPAFNALLKILEEPPPHILFILATTEAHKVPATISSRCQRFQFRRVAAEDIQARLGVVAEAEALDLRDDAAELLARLADGSVRDALALLDQCAGGQTIDAPLVRRFVGLTGSAECVKLLEAIRSADTETALGVVDKLYHGGRDMGALLGELGTLLRDILLTRIAPKGAETLLSGNFDSGIIDAFSTLTPEWSLSALTQIADAIADFGRSANRRLTVEICIIRLCDARLSGDMDALSARLAELERKLAAGPFVAAAQEMPPERDAEPEALRSSTEAADTVPWEEALPEPPADVPTQASMPEPDSSPPPPAAASTGEGAGSFWQQVLERAQPSLRMNVHALLRNNEVVDAALDGEVLHIYIADAFFFGVVERDQGAISSIEAAASEAAGHKLRVRCHEGAPPASVVSPRSIDSLDALIQKNSDIITVKDEA